MDLYKEWDSLNQTKFNNNPINKPEIMEALNQQSHSNLSELKKRLKYKIYWILLFTTIQVIWMLCSLKHTELLMILSFGLVTHLILLTITVVNYKKLQINTIQTADVTSAIQTNYTIIKNTLRLEQTWGLFGMPVSIITSSLIVNFYFGHTISDFFNNKIQLLSIIISLVVLVPLASIAASRMNKKAFGEHLHQLQKNIIQLETLEDTETLPA